MFFICLFVWTLSLIFIYKQEFGELFTRNNCYKSLSYPLQFIKISHYFPNGPIMMNIIFKMLIFKNEFDDSPIEFEKQFIFERYYGPCSSSILFSPLGIPFTKINLIINIYYFDVFNEIADFKYTFYNGFIYGYHLLLSRYSTFGLLVQIQNFGVEHIQNINITNLIDWEYLQLNTHFYNSICVITNNNRAVVLRPNYDGEKPFGFTKYLVGIYKEEGIAITVYQIGAFDCNADEFNPNESVVFFDEHSINTDITFYSFHMKKNNTNEEHYLIFLKLPNIRREYINKFRNLPLGLKKVFFVESFTEVEELPDGSKVFSSYNSLHLSFQPKDLNLKYLGRKIQIYCLTWNEKNTFPQNNKLINFSHR